MYMRIVYGILIYIPFALYIVCISVSISAAISSLRMAAPLYNWQPEMAAQKQSSFYWLEGPKLRPLIR